MSIRDKGKSSRMEGIINEAIANNPQSKHIITAFKPLFLARERLVHNSGIKMVEFSSIDGERLRRGVPCIRQTRFFFEDDPWEKIGLEVASAIRQGFPALEEDTWMLESKIRYGGIRLFNAYQEFPASMDSAMAQFSKGTNIKPPAAGLLLSTITRILLQAKAEALRDTLEGTAWEKGYCPVCGAHPTIAIIREKITQKWLHCSQCGCEWRFSRMACPGCEQENASGLDYFYLEGRNQETAFTCPSCKRYLITLNHISDLGEYDRDVTAMSLVHLDFIMQQKGLVPMTWCNWNVFSPPQNQQSLCYN